MAKTAVSKPELEALVLDRLQAEPGCEGVLDVSVAVYDLPFAPSNWSVETIDIGRCAPAAVEAALIRLLPALRAAYLLE